MNTRTRTLIFILSVLLVSGLLTGCRQPGLHTVPVANMEQLQGYFTYREGRPVIISGHRGGMMAGYPENCIESCEKTLSLMPSFFEIDPRLTKDSVLVLMHDATIDRTTNGSGKVSDYTYEELQQFYLKDREGNVTSYKIPTLEEMLDWGLGKTVFNLDNKKVPWPVYVKLLKGHNWQHIMLSVRSLEEALYYYQRVDNVMLCVAIFNREDYDKYKESGIPWNRLMAYVGYSMQPEQSEVYRLLRSHGVMCMTSVHPTSDRVQPDAARLEAYRQELAAKPDIIETDYPSLFLGLQ
ncbi:MAG: glycerophosphodiester phosphodiesterase family protein [Prolixibacteraceae bacterium]|jgi:glycerophosphoryl diester phosphodiesterase|nr:glycerophosphodiester phosphodiesterase family protein [Prolixibacteraceae bacterium]